HLNNTVFHCLQQKRWLFVAGLQEFILSEPMRKGISEIDLRIRIVNTAIGLKFSGQDEDAVRLLESVDWSASYRDFKLAIAVLQERYDDAIKIMRSIGKSGEMLDQSAYHTWPLFTRFRERPEFYDAYFEVYGEAFAEKIETDKGAVEAHAKSGDSGGMASPIQNVTDVEARDVTTERSTSKRGVRKGAVNEKPTTKRVRRVT
ncbi:hypothetical protein QMN58_26325, partial [Escherichia coli]|nr:hypothetical protein [Escherichia coli]